MEFLWKVCPFWFHFVAWWVSFFHFFRIWASLRWWREARVWTKCKKEEKQSKKESQNETLLIRNLCFFQLLFCWFLEQSWEVFFSALVAEVSQMRATWGHFSSHVAAKLESWKVGFRVHQTLLFRVSRGWVRTSWATFSNIFSGMGFETWFYDFLRNWGSSRSSKDDFWWAFQVHILGCLCDWFLRGNQNRRRAREGGD